MTKEVYSLYITYKLLTGHSQSKPRRLRSAEICSNRQSPILTDVWTIADENRLVYDDIVQYL